MGMAAFFVSVAPADLDRFRTDSDALLAFLYPDNDEDEPPNTIDVDKAWHGLHYLLSGSAGVGAPPLGVAILGGEEIGEEMDFGPARYFAPGLVRQIAAALAELDAEQLQQRYNPQDMEAQQIYPETIWVRDGGDAFDYLLGYFETLRVYFTDAAAQGQAIITWIA